jgi:hypothetical protein
MKSSVGRHAAGLGPPIWKSRSCSVHDLGLNITSSAGYASYRDRLFVKDVAGDEDDVEKFINAGSCDGICEFKTWVSKTGRTTKMEMR